MFSQNPADRILQRSDFHIPKNKTPEEVDQLELYVETVFSFPELDGEDYDKSTSIPLFFQSMIVDSPTGAPYIRIRLVATWERSANLEGTIESRVIYITCPENEKIENRSCIAAKRKDLDNIRVIYVPAVRDPSKQLKNISGTMMHQILGSVRWSEVTKSKIQKFNRRFKF